MYAQLVFNTLVSGLLLALVAVGFNLIFNTTKVFHLAHGALYVTGAYALLQFEALFSDFGFLPLVGSLVVVAIIALVIEKLVYQPLANRKAGQAITLISSIGVYLFLINLIALLYGNETKYIDPALGSSLLFAGLTIAPVQLLQLVTASCLIVGILILSKTQWFLKVRAMISEETVASVLGVNTKAIRLWMMILGSMLAGIAAILQLYDTGMDPQRGMAITLSAAVAVIIGGQGSISGTILASLLIAFLQTTTEWFISAQWKEGLTFLLLIAVILWRTEGIVSFKMRVEEK
ncbi:MAG: branched-chain amino acid ABC transporter permease [Gammaproteobacteria bacterium]|nr:MAG: branched-chain amino acid ABC transporter permease [Gammaproteobacteria bacterium]